MAVSNITKLIIGLSFLSTVRLWSQDLPPDTSHSLITVSEEALAVGNPATSRISKFEELPLFTLPPALRAPQIIITCKTEHAIIEFDQLKSETEMRLNNWPAGSYKLKIDYQNYDLIEQSIAIRQGMRYRIEIELARSFGILEAQAIPGAQWWIDQQPIGPGMQVPVGTHVVRVTAFGFESASRVLQVQKNRRIKLQAKLLAAPLQLALFKTTNQAFNPLAGGPGSAARLGFLLTNQAKVTVEARDAAGTVVWQKDLGLVTKPETIVAWNGRSQTGRALPEGLYSWRVRAQSPQPANQKLLELSDQIRVAYNVFSQFRSTFNGVSGLVLAGDTYTLPPLTVALNAGFIYGLPRFLPLGPQIGGAIVAGLQVGLGANMEINLANNWGADLSGKRSSYSAGQFRNNVVDTIALGYKWAFVEPRADAVFSAALTFRGAFSFGHLPETEQLPESDSTFSAVQLGLPLQLQITELSGQLNFHLEPTIGLGPWGPTVDSLANPTKAHAFVSLRPGISWSVDQFFVAISGMIRSTDFTRLFGIGYPIKLAAEFRFNPNQSNVALGLSGGVDWYSQAATGWVGLSLFLLIN